MVCLCTSKMGDSDSGIGSKFYQCGAGIGINFFLHIGIGVGIGIRIMDWNRNWLCKMKVILNIMKYINQYGIRIGTGIGVRIAGIGAL